jgi:RsiW-degrading membrane proteinase PrsW (M82 family)
MITVPTVVYFFKRDKYETGSLKLVITYYLTGGFFGVFGIFFFYVMYSTLLHLPPHRSTVSEDAGIEPRTVATSALAV